MISFKGFCRISLSLSQSHKSLNGLVLNSIPLLEYSESPYPTTPLLVEVRVNLSELR